MEVPTYSIIHYVGAVITTTADVNKYCTNMKPVYITCVLVLLAKADVLDP